MINGFDRVADHFGRASYAMSRTSIVPSGSNRTLNGSAVVLIGVDRRSVGRNDGLSLGFPFSRR